MENRDDKKSRGTVWVSLFIEINTAVYFDSFEIEYIPQEILKKTKVNQFLTIYLEYKMMILLSVDFIVSLSYNICLQEKLFWIIPICFLRMTMKTVTK